MGNQLPEDHSLESELAATRPFFWILLLVIAFLYAISLYTDLNLREPARLLPFTGVMVVHAGLHWFVLPRLTQTRQIVLYVVVQAALVMWLSLWTRQPAIIFGLYLALAGETVGLVETWRRSVPVVAGYLVLIVVAFSLTQGWTAVASWLPIVIIMLLFVMIYVVLYLRQLNAREESMRLLSELQTAHRQLSEYAQQVESLTLISERQRMARELHDTLAQGLAGLVLQLEAMEGHLERGNLAQVAQIVTQAKDRARDALASSRRAIDDLRRTDLPVGEAVREEVARFIRATGIACELTLPDRLSLSGDGAEHVVRCVSEGLANVAQHARATAVSVTVDNSEGQVSVVIHDNGVGFDPQAVTGGHYGLVGLRERARLAGGDLLVTSAIQTGTTLTFTIPAGELIPSVEKARLVDSRSRGEA